MVEFKGEEGEGSFEVSDVNCVLLADALSLNATLCAASGLLEVGKREAHTSQLIFKISVAVKLFLVSINIYSLVDAVVLEEIITTLSIPHVEREG